MSAHVLLNLLNEFRQNNKMPGLPQHYLNPPSFVSLRYARRSEQENIFSLKILSAYYLCCINLSALLTTSITEANIMNPAQTAL